MDFSPRTKYLVLVKILYFVNDRFNPSTLSTIWVALRPMLSKADAVKFGNPSFFDSYLSSAVYQETCSKTCSIYGVV